VSAGTAAPQPDAAGHAAEEAREAMRVLQGVLRDSEFVRTVVALLSINTPDRTESDHSELQKRCARWNDGRRP